MLQIKLVRSLIGRNAAQIGTVKALGLRKPGDRRELQDTPEIRGMIEKVKFLVEVQA